MQRLASLELESALEFTVSIISYATTTTANTLFLNLSKTLTFYNNHLWSQSLRPLCLTLESIGPLFFHSLRESSICKCNAVAVQVALWCSLFYPKAQSCSLWQFVLHHKAPHQSSVYHGAYVTFCFVTRWALSFGDRVSPCSHATVPSSVTRHLMCGLWAFQTVVYSRLWSVGLFQRPVSVRPYGAQWPRYSESRR